CASFPSRPGWQRVSQGPGPVALIGGGEHMEATAAIDRRLMEMTGREAPRVVLLPQAAAAKQRAKTVALARNHWSRLGASFTMAYPDQSEAAAIDSVLAADIIVLPGYRPPDCTLALGGCRIWILRRCNGDVRMADQPLSAGPTPPHPWAGPGRRLRSCSPLRPISRIALGSQGSAAPRRARHSGTR
ncbi:MAG: hypothetical protein DWQ20_01825, partial [Actinobacteria bacterium]